MIVPTLIQYVVELVCVCVYILLNDHNDTSDPEDNNVTPFTNPLFQWIHNCYVVHFHTED